MPIVDDAQRELLDRVMAAVAPGAFVGRPGFTADQNRTRFYCVMGCCGIVKSKRGIVPHGLRHQRANDVYEAECGVPSPVHGGHADDESARHRVSHMLGHSRSRQAELMNHLPAHLQRTVLFALNWGARDDNVCRLQWAWERKVPELERSVFVIPASEFKGQRPHVLILNDVAIRIVEECRGDHDEFVFVWRRERVKNIEDEPVMPYRPVHTMNNTAFQNARRAAKLERTRVHDLRHTFGQRLREAGVTEEDRALLLGHALTGMPQHYATATIAHLVEAANKVRETRDRTTLLRVVNG